MADVAEREGVAVICRDSSRLRDDVHGAPVLGFAGSPERKPQKPPIPGRNLPRGFNGLGVPPRRGRFANRNGAVASAAPSALTRGSAHFDWRLTGATRSGTAGGESLHAIQGKGYAAPERSQLEL